MADIEKKMEDIIRQESGDIREKSAADSGQRAESRRATASDKRGATSPKEIESLRGRERAGE